MLEVGSLHDERYKEYVGKFEPTLLRIEDGVARTSTGMKLAIDLVKVVGMRRAYRIAVLARNATANAKFDASRRSFLVRAAGAAAVLPVALAPSIASATTDEESTPSCPLTLQEAQRTYKLLLSSAKYRAAASVARADGLTHVSNNAFGVWENIEGFTASSVHVLLADDEDGRRRLHFTLLYKEADGSTAEGRFMSAVVDSRTNTIESALHVDATGVQDSDGDEGASGAADASDDVSAPSAIHTALSGIHGDNEVPAGVVRFQGQGLDISLTDGVWSGTPAPQPSDGATGSTPAETVVCIRSRVTVCAGVCRFLALVGLLPAVAKCFVICSVTFSVHCVVQHI